MGMIIQLTKFTSGGPYKEDGIGAVYIARTNSVICIAHDIQWLYIRDSEEDQRAEYKELVELLLDRNINNKPINDIAIEIDASRKNVIRWWIGEAVITAPTDPIPTRKLTDEEKTAVVNFGIF